MQNVAERHLGEPTFTVGLQSIVRSILVTILLYVVYEIKRNKKMGRHRESIRKDA